MMKDINIFMALERTTKRKYRFCDSDEQGHALPYGDRVLGTLYLDQALFATTPKVINITLQIKPIS